MTIQTAQADDPAPGAELTHADAEIVAEIAQESAAEIVAPIADAAYDGKFQSAANSQEIQDIKTWQTETNQTLETLTAAALSMSETMTQVLTLLQAQSQEPPTPQLSENAGADDPKNPMPPETPADQPPQDNTPEKQKAKRQKSWM